MEMIVYGYHGTSIEKATTILQQGFQASRNDYDWLGAGIYFWQDAPDRAWHWANQKYQNPVVIKAKIRIERTRAIDLLDSTPEHWQIQEIRYAYEALQTAIRKQYPKQTAKYHGLDRLVIDFVVNQLEQRGRAIDVVRSIFIEGRPIYEHGSFYDESHVQIAVRNKDIISDLEILCPYNQR
jgi:hypothetical protein